MIRSMFDFSCSSSWEVFKTLYHEKTIKKNVRRTRRSARACSLLYSVVLCFALFLGFWSKDGTPKGPIVRAMAIGEADWFPMCSSNATENGLFQCNRCFHFLTFVFFLLSTKKGARNMVCGETALDIYQKKGGGGGAGEELKTWVNLKRFVFIGKGKQRKSRQGDEIKKYFDHVPSA